MNEIRDLMIGIDFGEKYSQLCYYDRKACEPRSLAVKVGSSQYEAPTLLCRKAGGGGYCVGLEAEYFAREKEGILVDNLYELSGREGTVQVSDEDREPWELLAYFFKGFLKLLGVMDLVKNTRCLAITSPDLTPCRVRNFQKACEMLGYSRERCMLLDYGESFFYYVFTQKRETWNRNVGWYEFDREKVLFRRLVMNTGVRPVLVKLEEPVETVLPEEPGRKDESFAGFARDTLGKDLYSSIQITGEGFSQDWAIQSVRVLCFQKRKVFFGNNLFARGACAAAVERLENKNLKNYRYISPSLVSADVGMELRVMGAPAYYPLIEGGKNWYECRAECELILDDTEELVFIVNSMEYPEKRRVSMSLPGLPPRPNKTTRLSLELQYVSPGECSITVKDLGFGEMFPSSGKVWKETARW